MTAFSIEKWPVADDATREELMELQETHQIVPVPAYGTDKQLILPAAYRSSLENALVAVCFNLSHWSIQGKKGGAGNDVFTADILYLHVIVPPPPSASGNGKKRKVGLHFDSARAACKRIRFG